MSISFRVCVGEIKNGKDVGMCELFNSQEMSMGKGHRQHFLNDVPKL